ncbi:pre-toxin TG domain-containing protein [Chungangia koreensis]|uniref:Pre-toxin TG domain-containing protein n=2 Tax=Chungangia koreensis TaxID=752657 RepID=A0ABV8X8Z3_9LACT
MPSYINLTEMKGYDTGSNAQKLLTGGSSYGIKNALIDTGIGLFLGSKTKGLSKVSKGKILSADNLRSGGSVALDLIPGVSTVKGIHQALTGVNLVTGKKLSTVDRWAEVGGIVASLIPIPGAKIAGKYATKGVIKGISKATKFIGTIAKKSPGFFSKLKSKTSDFLKGLKEQTKTILKDESGYIRIGGSGNKGSVKIS